MSNYKKAIILVTIGNTIFGFSFMFSKILLNAGISVLSLLAVRFTIAFVVMSIMLLLKVAKVGFKEEGKKNKLWLLFLLGLCQPV